MGLCAVLAGLDEFPQTFVPGHSGQVGDVVVDLMGAACFLLVWFVVRCIWKACRKPAPPPES